MSLDPQMAAILGSLTSQGSPDWSIMTPDILRAASRMPPPEFPQPVGSVEDRVIAGAGGELAVRIYHPAAAAGGLPVLVYFHGGGFVIGDLDSHDNLCRAFCEALPAIVVSVDYRLAPESRFPAAVEDAFSAVCWAAEQAVSLGGDPARLIVGGDSAGGNLAAVACQLAQREGGPAIAHQMLLYPVCDADLERESYQRLGRGYFLETEMMRWFWDLYLPDVAQRDDPRACPLRAGSLRGLPAATVVTAGCDPLVEEGNLYAQRLGQDGVPVLHREYTGVIHGFMSFIGMADKADQAFRDVVSAVQKALV